MIGLGASGRAAAELAVAHGARVLGFDEGDQGQASATLPGHRSVKFFFGAEALQTAAAESAGIDLVVLSPGVPAESVLLGIFRNLKISIVAEIEFAYRHCEVPLLAITGTNGKTTTAGLAAHLLSSCGFPSIPCGNYGLPFSEVVMPGRSERVATVEVSSFQLERITSFRPKVALWLNFDADHLDRYDDLAEYRAAKMRIFEFQRPGDHVVVREGEGLGLEVQEVHRFSSRHGSKAEMVLSPDGDRVSYRGEAVAALSGSRLRGRHNAENLMAAMLGVHLIAGVAFGDMTDAIASFRPPPHRCEFVAGLGGVDYINDSKATNVHALASSLGAFSRPVVLIVGGKEKGLDYASLPRLLQGSVRHVVTMGEIGKPLAELIYESGVVGVEEAEDMDAAVRAARAAARPDDIVLLSPGTSSFDMFTGYAERGEAFRRAVEGL